MTNRFKKLAPAGAGGGGTAGVVGPAREATLGTRIHDILHRNATLGPLFVLLLAVVVLRRHRRPLPGAGATCR